MRVLSERITVCLPNMTGVDQLSLPHRHTFPLHDVRFFRTSADHTTWRRQTGIPDWLLDTPPRAYKAACENGGDRRDRTDDLMLAKHALSQLSYVPEGVSCSR